MLACTCDDWKQISSDHKELFQNHPTYGWIISWIEISKEQTHYVKNNYGISIEYCPFCGNKLQ